MTIKDQLIKLSADLRKVSEVPQLEAEILVSFSTDKKKEFLFSHPEYVLAKEQEKKLKSLLARRLKHEPISYITGTKEFFRHDFKVNKHVLIPRPESEQLVELAISETKSLYDSQNSKKISIHELATGSGAVIISLAHALQKSGKSISYSGSDISVNALSVAKSNAKSILKNTRNEFKKLDILKVNRFPSADILIANPPYIPTKKIESLKPEVKDFEPKKALDGGENGMKFYQSIFQKFAKNPSKVLILELESENAEEIFSIAGKLIPSVEKKLYKDLSGKDRILLIRI